MLATTDRQLAVTHIFLRLVMGIQPRCLLRQTDTLNVFLSSVGIWDTTAMLAEIDGPSVMTNTMLAKSDRQAEPLKFFDDLRSNSLNLDVSLDAIIVIGILCV